MKKKYYLSPNIEVCHIQTTAIMATSAEPVSIEVENGEDYEGEFRAKSSVFVLWDEDE